MYFIVTITCRIDENQTSISVNRYDPSTIKVPFSSFKLEEEAKPYIVTFQQLEDVGFTNIHTIEIRDFLADSSHRPGRVYSVTFGGRDSFSRGERFHKDIKVVIYYYAEP